VLFLCIGCNVAVPRYRASFSEDAKRAHCRETANPRLMVGRILNMRGRHKLRNALRVMLAVHHRLDIGAIDAEICEVAVG
jgi:hypothetical protein